MRPLAKWQSKTYSGRTSRAPVFNYKGPYQQPRNNHTASRVINSTLDKCAFLRYNTHINKKELICKN
jgi:hypothetical protein